MKLRLILQASAALFLAASCTPYDESPPPQAPTDPAVNKQTEEEKQKIAEQREKKKKEADELANKEKRTEGQPTEPGGTPGNPDPDKTTAKPEAEKAEIRVAKPVPGKPGFVFSPFNNKIIDVKGIPSGRLVADPTYPASEKKHFRVP
jgi:hypothetical protein